MKIAVDFREASRAHKTGKGWYAYNLMRAVLEQDAQNEYIFYVDDDAAVDKISASFAPFATNITWRVINKKSIFWHLAVLRGLKSASQNVHPDLFLALTSFIIPALAPRNIKTIITVHDLIAFLFPSHNRKAVIAERLTLGHSLKKAAAIIAISENTKQDLLSRFNPPQEKITIIYPAASDNFKKLSQEETNNFRIEQDLPDRFILGVGTLEPRKNFTTLIKAFAAIAKDFTDLRLIIIGQKGWRYKEIFESVRRRKLENKVIFKGYAKENDLVKYYNAAEAFVFPSLYEGFGIPPLEAMKCGCPVIASNAASMPEVIGTAGLLVDPMDIRGFAEAIKQVLTAPPQVEELIKRGLEQSQKFSYKTSAARLLQTFKNI